MPSSSLYHHPSARVNPLIAFIVLLLALAAAATIGAVYGVIDHVNPYIKIRLFVTLGAGFANAFILALLVKRGKIHNLVLAMLIAALSALTLLAASWESWLFVLLNQHFNISPIAMVLHPRGSLFLIRLIYEHGAWGVFGISFQGPLVAFVWLLEAAMLCSFSFFLVHKVVTQVPFCSNCNRWCDSRSLVNLPLINQTELRRQLENKNFAAIGAAGISPEEARRFLHVYLQGCPTCDTTQTLCIDYTTLTTNDRGITQLKHKPVVNRLLLTSEETAQIAGIVAAMEPPPPDPDGAPSLTPADHTPALSASAFRTQKPDLSP